MRLSLNLIFRDFLHGYKLQIDYKNTGNAKTKFSLENRPWQTELPPQTDKTSGHLPSKCVGQSSNPELTTPSQKSSKRQVMNHELFPLFLCFNDHLTFIVHGWM
jgi:hypothetical protein